VDEARAEWLRSVGRDPFNELVIPATGIKLLQWTGRAIRTEEDQAHVVCYDKRLTLTAYGRRMLNGLPPYRQEQRKSGSII
jgi:ATP-dependent DNA helicase DinG